MCFGGWSIGTFFNGRKNSLSKMFVVSIDLIDLVVSVSVDKLAFSLDLVFCCRDFSFQPFSEILSKVSLHVFVSDLRRSLSNVSARSP